MKPEELRRQMILGIVFFVVLGTLLPWIWRNKFVAPHVARAKAELTDLSAPAPVAATPAPSRDEVTQLRQRRDDLKARMPSSSKPAVIVQVSPEQALTQLLQKIRSDGLRVISYATDAKGRTQLMISCDYQQLVLLLRDFPSSAPGLAVTAVDVQAKSSRLNCDLSLAPATANPEKK
jgi:hypothetical protein